MTAKITVDVWDSVRKFYNIQYLLHTEKSDEQKDYDAKLASMRWLANIVKWDKSYKPYFQEIRNL